MVRTACQILSEKPRHDHDGDEPLFAPGSGGSEQAADGDALSTDALMAFFGGFGTLWGPILGALILEPGQQYLTLQVSNSYASELIWGSLFLLVILFLPRGVVPMAGEKAMAWRARRERRRAGQPAAARPAAAGTADAALPGPAGASTPGGRSAR